MAEVNRTVEELEEMGREVYMSIRKAWVRFNEWYASGYSEELGDDALQKLNVIRTFVENSMSMAYRMFEAPVNGDDAEGQEISQ